MSDIAVVRNDDQQRYETTVDGTTAFLDFEIDGDRITLVHTEVPSSLEGRGVGSAIVRAALEDAWARDLSVVPRCPFVRAYLERHPEEAGRTKIV
jgi:predicted GNAT family acetyltransferase